MLLSRCLIRWRFDTEVAEVCSRYTRTKRCGDRKELLPLLRGCIRATRPKTLAA